MTWVFTVVVPFSIIVVIGLPVMALFTLYKNRDHLDSAEMVEK